MINAERLHNRILILSLSRLPPQPCLRKWDAGEGRYLELNWHCWAEKCAAVWAEQHSKGNPTLNQAWKRTPRKNEANFLDSKHSGLAQTGNKDQNYEGGSGSTSISLIRETNLLKLAILHMYSACSPYLSKTSLSFSHPNCFPIRTSLRSVPVCQANT